MLMVCHHLDKSIPEVPIHIPSIHPLYTPINTPSQTTLSINPLNTHINTPSHTLSIHSITIMSTPYHQHPPPSLSPLSHLPHSHHPLSPLPSPHPSLLSPSSCRSYCPPTLSHGPSGRGDHSHLADRGQNEATDRPATAGP